MATSSSRRVDGQPPPLPPLRSCWRGRQRRGAEEEIQGSHARGEPLHYKTITLTSRNREEAQPHHSNAPRIEGKAGTRGILTTGRKALTRSLPRSMKTSTTKSVREGHTQSHFLFFFVFTVPDFALSPQRRPSAQQ